MNSLETFIQQYLAHHNIKEQQISNSKVDRLKTFHHFLKHPRTNHRWVTQTLSHLLSIPWLDLDYFEPTKLSLQAVSENLLRQYPIFPLFQRQEILYLGVANPFEPMLVDTLRFYTGNMIRLILVEWSKLESLRKTLLSNPALSLQALPHLVLEDTKSTTPSDNIDDPPLIRYVTQLLHQAVQEQASDIHFEPHTNSLSIRFRIDGVLKAQPSPPSSLSARILSRIKIMAQLDIAEKRLPQNGRFSFTVPDNDILIDCRVSTCPTLSGEKIAIRLLDSKKANLDIKTLGFNIEQHRLFVAELSKPQGMILVTGPTGSGKTLTLYSGLNYLNQTSVNISSAEDPIEIRLSGINQVNIQPKIGLDFAEILKVFLRQDPDIIMIGEMRDPITAQIGIQAAQTGHLVLSTLHTNSAADTLTRLLNMGIAAYNVASSVSLIIAQRLCRRLCPHCKQPTTLAPTSCQSIHLSTHISAFKAIGCKECIQGYKGRIGIFELLPITTTLADSILEKQSIAAIEKQAKAEGMLTLKEAALAKLSEGIIDLVEMNRVIK